VNLERAEDRIVREIKVVLRPCCGLVLDALKDND
jgi:hypothetical protein